MAIFVVLVIFFSSPDVDDSYQVEVDRALRFQALDYFAKHPDAGYITLNIAPNWIENILDSHTIPTLEMIEDTGIDPKHVVIEITEAKGDLNSLKEMVKLYHQAGLMVALDDFGAGAWQMDRIEALEPDIVKLDMRLFKQASRGGKSADIALSVSSIANRVGCHIVCEGVETVEEFHFGIECGSNHIQGYIFHKALADTISSDSTVNKVRELQKSYLKEKSIKLVRASEQNDKSINIVSKIKNNYLNGQPLKVNSIIKDSDICRYYICDYDGIRWTLEALDYLGEFADLRVEFKAGNRDFSALGNISAKIVLSNFWKTPLSLIYFNGYGREVSSYHERNSYVGIGI
jgi:EAL domain-containing protein (putative c-di-GMP-specific phosphodiesterase class I)